MRARLLPLLALAALLWAGNAAAFALSSGQAESPAFSFRLDRQAASGGELVQLKMEAGPAGKRAAGFRARVQYDGSALQYVETKTASRLGSGTVRVNGDSNPVYAVYVCGVGGKSAPSLSGTVLTFVFQVKSGAAGSAFLRADADDICDFSGSPLAPDCSSALWLETSPALSDEARLTALEPSAGTLEPAFSPDTCEYRLAVGPEVGSVLFRADAARGGTVRVSRKTLHAAGSETEISITVTSADRSEKAEYTVTVARAAKSPESQTGDPPTESAGGPENPPPPSSAPAASGPAKAAAASVPPRQSYAAERVSASGPGAPGPESGAGTQTFPSPAWQTGSAPQTLKAAEGTSSGRTPDIILERSRMPAYLVGMLAAGFCIATGIALFLWLAAPPKKKKP